MSAAKERRRAARAAKFGGHEPDATYRPDQQPATVTRGREYDTERAEKADVRELESVDRPKSPTPAVGTSESPKIKSDDARGNTPGREWDSARGDQSDKGRGPVESTVETRKK